MFSFLNFASHRVNCPRSVSRVFDSIIFLGVGFILLITSLLSCGPSRSVESVLEIKADSVFVSLDGELPLQRGYEVYRAYGCILCHGLNGEGGVKNRNAQTAELIPSLTYTAEGFTTHEFRQKILHGVSFVAKLDSTGETPPLAMPGWPQINKSELNDLTLYVWNLYPNNEEDDW